MSHADRYPDAQLCTGSRQGPWACNAEVLCCCRGRSHNNLSHTVHQHKQHDKPGGIQVTRLANLCCQLFIRFCLLCSFLSGCFQVLQLQALTDISHVTTSWSHDPNMQMLTHVKLCGSHNSLRPRCMSGCNKSALGTSGHNRKQNLQTGSF